MALASAALMGGTAQAGSIVAIDADIAPAAKPPAAQTAAFTLSAGAEALLRRLGITPRAALAQQPVASAAGMSEPYEPADAPGGPLSGGDSRFHALFLSWKNAGQPYHPAIAVPSQKPVERAVFTSGFGYRVDPFGGYSAMHPGIDLAGPIGTPIYAAADGIVDRAGWMNGYGNLVELDHGKSIQTRYGHLSAILVTPGEHVHRGDLIARMGSTGRSTGSHLHYEVRIDGSPVNPLPFLQSADYLLAVQRRAGQAEVAMGGPAPDSKN